MDEFQKTDSFYGKNKKKNSRNVDIYLQLIGLCFGLHINE